MYLRDRQVGFPWSRRASYAQLAIPLALILLITLVALRLPKGVPLGPLLVVAPALTASFAGPKSTAVIGAIATAALITIRVVRGDLTLPQNIALVGALVIMTCFVVFYASVQQRRLRELNQLRAVSDATQRVVLRPLPSQVGPLRMDAIYLAATAEAQVGGDLYAAVRTDDGVRLIIGDVSGKGLATIGDAAVLLYAFREAAHQRVRLPELVADLETSIARNMAELTETDPNAREYFITSTILEVPEGRAAIRLVDCGHPPPLLLRGQHVITLQADEPAPPLGLGGLADIGYQAQLFPFEPGDFLLLYTDGVIEARNAAGDFYPLAERIGQWYGTDADDLARYVRDDLLSFAGGRLDDDAALVAIKREYA